MLLLKVVLYLEIYLNDLFMKKLLLLGGFAFMTLGLSAQQRLALYEEFTGENCPPCAALNPGLMQTVNNHDQVLIIKYQSPIPTGGPIYAQNTTDIQARMSYYSVPFAPYGRLNGTVVGEGQNSAGNVSYTTDALLTAAYNEATTIDVEIVGYNRTLGSNTVTFDVNVKSTTAQQFSNAVLHVALIENLIYSTPPGTNGETEFYNVVRKMYPSAQGQAIQGSFTANQIQTFTITADLPSHVDANNPDLRFVAFVQDNATKKVLNADVTKTVDSDAYSLSLNSPQANEILCGAQSVTSVSKFKNVGGVPITSAEIYYRVSDGVNVGAWSSGNFTGSLAPGASTTFEMNNIQGLEGVYMIQDSIGKINGNAPENTLMKSSSVILRSLLTDAQDLFPYINTFESADSRNSMFSAPINGSTPFNIYRQNGAGYGGSGYFLAYLNYSLPAGISGVALFPLMNIPEGNKTLEFYVAYAQYTNENDQLEVVYSDNCGATWNSVWSKSGSDLATVAPRTSEFIPNSDSQYRKEEVDLTNVPDGSYIGFRATSDYGNHLFVDNIWFREGGVSTSELSKENSLMVFPNPTHAEINLKVESELIGTAQVIILDVLGRQVYQSAIDLNGATQTVQLPTSTLASGVYTVQLTTDTGSQQIKFTKK